MNHRYEIVTFEKLGEDDKVDRVVRNMVANTFAQVYDRVLEKGKFISIESIIRRR